MFRSTMLRALFFALGTLSLYGLFAHATPAPLRARQQAIADVNVGLNAAILTDLAGLVENPLNPGPWIQNLTNDFEQQVDVLLEVKPAAGAPQQKDIVDLSVQIILEVAKGVLDIPLLILISLQLPFLDNAISQWLSALNQADPGTSSQVGQAIPQSDYIHLLQLNLTVTLDILGLGNILEGLGL